VEDIGWARTVEPKFGIFQNSMSVEESMPYSVFERLTKATPTLLMGNPVALNPALNVRLPICNNVSFWRTTFEIFFRMCWTDS